MTDLSDAPVGTIALLFTDIEGSTQLAAGLGRSWAGVLADHHALVADAICCEGGFVDGTEGDAFFATFMDARSAARAAVAALRGLRAHRWPAGVGELRVRMGLHVGYVERAGTGYVGLEVHRAARVAAAAHGGQLLLTGAARELIGDEVSTEFLGAHRLKDFPAPIQLYCAVLDGRGAASFPAPRTEEVRPTNLPVGLPSLIGRERDLDRVREALLDEGERVVTLTGRGGAGKTSLALLAGAEMLDAHPGGVWVARLAAVDSPDGVLDAIAAAVGAEREVEGSSLQAIRARLRRAGTTLLVLDNMEHVIAAQAMLEELLDALPQVRMLITSQVPLRMKIERVVLLDALDADAALALIERVADRRGVQLSVDDNDRRALVEVVGLLDGLPLALELAAARLSLLTAAQLRDRLRESIDLLTDASVARPERHRSLRATVEWTLGLLQGPAQTLFARMGVFAGPVELEELEAVAGGDGMDVIEALAGLLDVALVRRVEAGDGQMRFGLPEALRQIASRLLDARPEAATWRRAHAQRQHDLIWAARTTFVDGGTYRAAIAADAEIAAALRWCQAHSDPLAVPIAAARAMLLANLGRMREAIALLGPLIESPPREPALRSLCLAAHASALLATRQLAVAKSSADAALSVADAPHERCLALLTRGLVHLFSGEHQAGLSDHTEATGLAQHLGPAMLSAALVLEAQALITVGALDEAGERLACAQHIGAPVDASCLRYLDTLEGDLAMAFRRPADALEPYARSLERAQGRDDALQILFDLRGLANALASLGRDGDAMELIGLAEMQSIEVGGPGAPSGEHLQGDEPIRVAARRLGVTRAAEHRQRGLAVSGNYRVARACRLARA